MVVGVARIDLVLHGCSSLKDKRRVVRGLLTRMQRRFNVSAAEVAELETWRRATLGVSFVSTERRHADEVLAKVVRWVDGETHGSICDYTVEIL